MKFSPRARLVVAALFLPLLAVPVSATSASAATCANPRYTTSNPNGMWSSGGYVVHNNMWNASGYNVRETLKACSHRNWYVTATADNRSGDGAVSAPTSLKAICR